MLLRRNSEFPSHKTEEPEFASKATDLEALRTAVVDAAGVGYGLWFSYVFVLLYLAIAAGAVTHRDLLLENPVKLPFLNIELSLKAFFFLGPLVFLVVHAYVLLHFLLLAGKVGAFHNELRKQIPDDNKRAQLRRQLPSNIFVQFLAGPREVREGIVGSLLELVTSISLVLGPVALLILFQLQFLAYHNAWITACQRIAVILDLMLLWLLWLPIGRGETRPIAWWEIRPARMIHWFLMSLLAVLLVTTIATFPGEWLDEELYGTPASFRQQRSATISLWRVPHELLVGGYGTWSNVLVLPKFEIGDRLKLDPEGKISLSPAIFSASRRRFEGAVLDGAHFSKVDFTGAELQGASLSDAMLEGALLNNAQLQGAYLASANLQGASLKEANLQGIDLSNARLEGALLDIARLQAAYLIGAKLQGASLQLAQLQGASLQVAQLQGADLNTANLQGASLEDANLEAASFFQTQLQGASLHNARFANAYLYGVFIWRTEPPTNEQVGGAVIRDPQPGPIGLDFPRGEPHPWSDEMYASLISLLKIMPDRNWRSVERIERLGIKPYDPDPGLTETWDRLAAASDREFLTYPKRLTGTLISIGCATDGAPFVIDGLTSRLYLYDELSPAQKAEVAGAFLDESRCPGSRGLSEEHKTELRRIRDADAQQPSSDTSPR
jgi:uncharacterized protein YjbI with pentapeptide repeats